MNDDEPAVDPETEETEPPDDEAAHAAHTYIRQPIVGVLGHVDHGKTTLLDKIRGGTVAAREPGAITQHIGATEVPMETIMNVLGPLGKGKSFSVPGLLFIDTPGHHSFNALRARGGALADIAILVVDLNEGLMPQTIESIRILRSTKTPFVVAANKLDLIPMYESAADSPFLANLKKQSDGVQSRVEDRLLELIGRLYDHQLPAERYDRIKDFKKNVAVVPVSAETGEGVPDLLLVLVGLAQRFLEDRLETDEEGPGQGTVLEVKEERGLGLTLDTIIYAGTLHATDHIAVAGKNGPFITSIRALLKPKELDEIRDPREPFRRVKSVRAASGVKINAPDLEDVLPGARVRALAPEDDEDEILARLAEESEITVPLDTVGLAIKADTLGSLEALANELREKDAKIRFADLGPVSRRDVIQAAATDDPLTRVLVAFNVKMLPDATSEANAQDLTVLHGNIIYQLLDDYDEWHAKAKEAKDQAERVEIVHPCMIRFLPDCTFRVSSPAVIGVRVMAGRLVPGMKLLKEDGRTVGPIKSIQKEGNTIDMATRGDEVAVAIDGATVGRQIKEEDILYLDIPGRDAKQLFHMEKLSTDEREVLEKVAKIKRRGDRFWGM